MLRSKYSMAAAAVWCLLVTASLRAYVDLAPTLGRIVRESQTITLAEVERFYTEKGAVILNKVRDLKGATGTDPLKHYLVRSNETAVDRPLLEWAEAWRRCVVFLTGKTGIVCVSEAWYQMSVADDGWWHIGPRRPDLPLAYYSTASRLAEAVPAMVAGKSIIITTLLHGADREGASFDLALNRADYPGLVKVQRLRATLRMPDVAMGVGSNPAIVMGQGRASLDDLTALRAKLQATDATPRSSPTTTHTEL